MNNFYDMIYEVVRHVPKGRVTTYGAIAKYLGSAMISIKKISIFAVL
ncbi:MAG: MGMT family protein [Bacteroidia bacterium]